MNKIVVAICVMLTSMLAAAQEAPPSPYESWGVCSFECCTYREWTADADIPVHEKRSEQSAVLFHLQPGDSLDAITGVVVAENPAAIRIDRAVRDGAFHLDESNTLIATWQAMLSVPDAHDVPTALSFIATGSRDKYGQAFSGLGARTSDISPTLRDFALSSIASLYATATVSRNYPGKLLLQYVTFVRADDSWEILEF